MKVIILSAGQGKRLRPLTDSMPKALLKINNTTLLERHLTALQEYGFHDIIIVVGFHKDSIYNLIAGKDFRLNISFVENEIFHKTRSSYSLWLALQNCEDSIIFMDADLFYEMKLLNYINEEYDKNILLASNTTIDEESVKVMGENSVLKEIGKYVSNKFQCYGEAVGIIGFNKSGCKILK